MAAVADTIAAIATAPGSGAVGIVRIAGPAAFGIADAIFHSPSIRASDARSHRIVYGQVTDPSSGERLDDALLLTFRAPHSYTGDDAVELSCHGGAYLLSRVLRAALDAGARLARPGEFTYRAFLNGRLDLTQAEAVADLIEARSDQALRAANRLRAGMLSGTVGELRDSLMDACSSLEAAIETDDEDERSAGVPPATAEFECDLDRLIGRLADLAAQSSAGRAVREGVRIAIVGRPNVGKSALFNAVLRRSRAIVAPSPGTTRDVIEETVELGGLAITLMDTAGVRRPRGPVEDQGVALSRQAIETADRVLCVLDARRPVSTSDLAIASDAGDRLVAIALNKTDVASLAAVTRAVRRLTLDERSAGVPPATVVAVSASTGQGIQELESLLVRTMTGPSGGLDGILVTHERHARAIGQAHESALRAREGLRRRMPLDVISVDLREAADALADIAGQSLTEDVIGRVFERFCIGK